MKQKAGVQHMKPWVILIWIGIGIYGIFSLLMDQPFFHTISYSYAPAQIIHSNNSSDKTRGWKLYTSKGELHYSFQYPPTWKLDDSRPHFSAQNGNVGILVRGPLAGSDTIEELTEKRSKGAVKIIEKKRFTIDNHKAIVQVLQRTGGIYADVYIADVVGTIVYTDHWLNGTYQTQRTVKKPGMIEIQFVAVDLARYQQERPVFDAFLSTFRFMQ